MLTNIQYSPSWSLRFLLVSIVITFSCGEASFAFSILEPPDSSTLNPGQHITVRLDPNEVEDITEVKYYWYREQEDMLKESAGDNLARISTSSDNPPFGGKIVIPNTAIGHLRLLAVGRKGGAQFGEEDWAIFDEVIVNIQPEAELVRIDFETEKPMAFGRAALATVYAEVDFLGKTLDLPVIGVYADGVTRPIRVGTSGTTYYSSNEKVVIISPDGVLQLVGNGNSKLSAKNQGKEATLEVIVDVKDDPNEPPEANPGKNQTVRAGTRVRLNGLQSFDPEGGSLQYFWSQIGGSKVSLLDLYSSKASFLAPRVEETHTFRFKLRVTDTLGADSLPAIVDVIVEP